ncbi:35533_t:CDS:2 [Gigaspora margarita]|uniref:35533_t:CDS:1 n=1 Tax=Gigaspora margarita TaxID=4874 RepID=A0ABN7V2L1_GIGMA|nr:35533_t:CDS:2 [Gigaspora margarita]
MSRIITIFLIVSIFVLNSYANVIPINVGETGFSFTPQNVNASKGDIANVVQSNGPYGTCNNPTPGGFSFNSTATPPPPVNGTFFPDVFNYTINQDSGQIFFTCDLPGRCDIGKMFGSITIVPGGSSTTNGTQAQGNSSTTNNDTNNVKSTASTTYDNTFTFAAILISSMFVSSFITFSPHL